MADTPPNIKEFNTIAGLIFAQLYDAFPAVINVEAMAVARAMGIEGEAWNGHVLPSGQSFMAAFSNTIGWLGDEDFTRYRGGSPEEGVRLTSKGLAAMNVVPLGLKQSVGTALAQSAQKGSVDFSRVGDLIGGTIAGFTKRIGG